MLGKRHFLFLVTVVMLGCAPQSQPLPPRKPVPIVWEGKSNLTLEQITPIPHLAAPTSQPDSRPPIDALMLYTQARDATLRNDQQSAIGLLERAVVLDPSRFSLRYELGWAYANANKADNAIAAFEEAARLQPNHLETQTELGRLYLNKNNLPEALTHLRLAMQTLSYPTNDAGAAIVDYLLGQTLKDSGYDRAALNQYTDLLVRLQNPSDALQRSQELVDLLNQPDSVLEQIGEILEKHADYKDALKAFKPGVDRQPDHFDLQARYARDLAQDGQRDAALSRAVDQVVRYRAGAASLHLLREVCGILKIDNGVVSELRKLYIRRPQDHAVLFALADTLVSKDRVTEAWDLLQSAWQKSPVDVATTRRLFLIDKKQEQIQAAAALLIHALAVNPDALQDYAGLLPELFRVGQPNHLRLVSLQLLKVPPEDEAARQVWISMEAKLESRMTLRRTALEAAVRYTPPFAPAFRMLLDVDWRREELTLAEKVQASDQLIEAAKNSGNPALAAELRGRSLMVEKQPAQAADAFIEAAKLGGRSAALQLITAENAQALADMNGITDSTYQMRLRKIILDHPMDEDAYEQLLQLVNVPGGRDAAMKVISAWLTADPQSSSARLTEAQLNSWPDRLQDAENELNSLYADDPDNDEVFAALVHFYSQASRANDLISKLENARVSHPRDTDLVLRLVHLYADQKQNGEAIRLLDSTRGTVADDAALLYAVAEGYKILDQQQARMDVLQQVLQLDPGYAGACNDLGYGWVEDGKNLSEAEAYIRIAVAQEPDKTGYVDSLGWVLYKLGHFEEARNYLQQAAIASPDSVVMNHLGDVLYKLNRPDEAIRTWKKALAGLVEDPNRPEKKRLRLQLMMKIAQH